MIGDRRILVVCPARGGSKGIPLKNLKPFCGVPLVARVGQLVARIPMVDSANRRPINWAQAHRTQDADPAQHTGQYRNTPGRAAQDAPVPVQQTS